MDTDEKMNGLILLDPGIWLPFFGLVGGCFASAFQASGSA